MLEKNETEDVHPIAFSTDTNRLEGDSLWMPGKASKAGRGDLAFMTSQELCSIESMRDAPQAEPQDSPFPGSPSVHW
jgi:hypothetical protein